MNKPTEIVTLGPVRRGEARRAVQASVILSREASRLLAALATPGAEARTDPFDGEALIVRREEGGISLGGGRFTRFFLGSVSHDLLVEPPAPVMVVSPRP